MPHSNRKQGIIVIKVNKEIININYFPDYTLKLNFNTPISDIKIEWKFENNEEQITLLYLVKHFRDKIRNVNIELTMLYIPNARMDRTENEDEVFTLKYFCEFINSLKFNKVIVLDPHSSVATSLINNIVSIEHNPKLHEIIKALKVDRIFFPDEGAGKRYSKKFKLPYCFGIKKRDFLTGKIQGLDIYGDIPTKKFDVFIIDDICSKGGTFLHSARKLKEVGAGKIFLYITHCENTILDGELINSGLIEKIYTTDSIFTKNHPLIEII